MKIQIFSFLAKELNFYCEWYKFLSLHENLKANTH